MRIGIVLLLCVLLVAGVLLWPPTSEVSQGDSERVNDRREEPVAVDTGMDPSQRSPQGAVRSSKTARRVEFRGRVVQGGAPLARVRLRIVDGRGATRREEEVGRTSANGAFAFEVSRTDPFRLAFDGPSVPHGFERRVQAFGDVRDLGEVDVPVPGTLRGRLVDERGQPIAGAALRALRGSAVRAHTRSAVDGSFRIDRLGPAWWHVRVEHAAFRPKSIYWELRSGQDGDFGDVVVPTGARVEGIVVSRSVPIAGASVTPSGSFGMPIQGRTVRTDRAGRFRLDRLDGESLHIAAAGHLTRERVPWKGKPWPVVIELEPAGTVICDVRGATGRSLTAEVVGEEFEANWVLSQGIAKPDRHVFDRAHPGTYYAIIRAQGYGISQPKRIRVEAGRKTEVRFQIEPHPEFVVCVRDAAGEAIAGAQVQVDLGAAKFDHGLSVTIFDQKAKTDREGTARFRFPRQCACLVAVNHAGAPRLVRRVTEAELRAGRAELMLRSGGAITGRLTDTSYLGDFEAHVLVRKPNTKENLKTLAVQPDGTFRAVGVEPGSYVIALSLWTRRERCVGDGVDPSANQNIEVVAGQETRVELTRRRPGRVEGVVTGSTRPGRTIEVRMDTDEGERFLFFREARARTEDWSDEKFLRADEAGRFRFVTTSPGRFFLEAKARDAPAPGPRRPLRIQDPSGIRKLTLELGSVSVSGAVDVATLTSEQRRKIERRDRQLFQGYLFTAEEAHLDAFTWSRDTSSMVSGMHRIRIAADGSFVIADVPSGVWLLRLCVDDEVVADRVLRVVARDVDLGRIRCGGGKEVAIDVADASKREGTVSCRVRRRVDGFPRGVFVTSVDVEEGRVKLGSLRAGVYELEWFVMKYGRYVNEEVALGLSTRVRVVADGRVEPRVLRLVK